MMQRESNSLGVLIRVYCTKLENQKLEYMLQTLKALELKNYFTSILKMRMREPI